MSEEEFKDIQCVRCGCLIGILLATARDDICDGIYCEECWDYTMR